VLPKRIILVRHAESEGNIDNFAYTYVPDPQVPLVSHAHCRAFQGGLREMRGGGRGGDRNLDGSVPRLPGV